MRQPFRLDATTYRVRSRTDPSSWYRVTIGPDGWPAHCPCEENFWRGDCAHREEIGHQIAREEAA